MSFEKNQAVEVLLVEGIHERAIKLLAEEGFKVRTLGGAPNAQELVQAAAECQVLGIRSKTQIRESVLSQLSGLCAIGCFCIGTNQVDLDAACIRGVPTFNSPFSNTRSVAELTLAETIALHRRLTERSDQLHAGSWTKSASGAHEVRGRTIGIVGYGHIGSQVSVLAEAIGMRVVYYDIASKLPLGNARSVGSLEELLGTSDVVTLHVPASATTKNLIGAKQLAQMKKGAYLINNSRGSVVDVAALADAVRAGELGGAAVDVFPEEPASAEERFFSELQSAPNVILTPHIGGSTQEAQAAIAEDVATKLIRYMRVGTTAGAVNVPQVELPPRRGGEAGETAPTHRILHFHKNVPGVLSKMHGLIADEGVNVAAEYLQTNAQVGYIVLDVDPSDGQRLLAGLKKIPETIRVRLLW